MSTNPSRDTTDGNRPSDTADGVVDPSRFLWHLTRAHVDYVLHYTHWIPISKGFTDQMLTKYYPGWTLGGLIQVFDRAGIRILPDDLGEAAGAPHGGRCHWQVVAVYFNDDADFHVEWDRSLHFDTHYLAHELPAGNEAPGGDGPLSGRNVAPRPTKRPVDLSGQTFFD